MQEERDKVHKAEDRLVCYNRGCGQTFYNDENQEDSCTYHPGSPFFHDAYKGWTCCNKKCTDFTEFLNFKGCKKGFHNSLKPPEPEKPPVDESNADEVTKHRAPAAPITQRMKRPAYETPMVPLVATVSATLVEQVSSLIGGSSKDTLGTVAIGTTCKNGGCKTVYLDDEENDTSGCVFHPGCPIFHEGLKFWSCCQRRTTDFQAFLDQEGCKTGSHVWVKERHGNQQQGCKTGSHVWVKERHGSQQQVSCRMDWHQTGSDVVVSVFAKKYDPGRSTVRLSPVRLAIQLFFPEEDSCYYLDVELRGVVDVDRSCVQMLPSKLEVKMHKAEPGSWAKLDVPRAVPSTPGKAVQTEPTPEKEKLSPADLEPVDLSDL